MLLLNLWPPIRVNYGIIKWIRTSGMGLLWVLCSFTTAAQLPDGFIRQQVATGLNPTSMVIAPDGRIFITEKNGTIRIVRNDVLLDVPLLTLEVDDSNERGLGHMVLHPDFDHNGYYYVYYTVPGLHFNRISRFTANGDHTIPGSEVIILELDLLGGEVHNGGDMVFGSDGYLYVATGDGGQNWRGEDLGATGGKILRIDEAGQPVSDNPWYNLPYLRANLVYAYGFRNPFTLTLDQTTGLIYANDVGGSKYEEINVVEKGRFYGWPKVEGKRTSEVVPAEYKDPLFQYLHQNDYCAVVGSVVYHAEIQQFPEAYAGRYFYSDYCTGHIRMLDPATGQDKGIFMSDGDRVIDLDVAADGSLYYLERKGLGDGSPEDNTGTNEGKLWKVTYTGSGAPFIALQPQSQKVSVGESARFEILCSGAQPITYTWFVNGEMNTITTDPAISFSNVTAGQDSSVIQVEVRNGFGFELSSEAILRVTTNHRPNPVITAPDDTIRYKAGSSISFAGMATDPEDGVLPPASLSWKIDFHHDVHTHPAMSWTTGTDHGDWIIPPVGETSSHVWYRIYLKATDQDGLSKVTFKDVYPQVGEMHVSSSPDSLLVFLDGAPVRAPYDITGVQGVSRFITAPYKQVRGQEVYFFDRWSDDVKEVNREIKSTTEEQSFQAMFEGIPVGRGTGLTASYYDNILYEGEPVAVALDTLLDHQFLLKAPYPGVPEDNFGIVWRGYLQPYRSGMYQITAFADDGVFVAIDGDVVLQNWIPGVHYETGSIYLEEGRLYPIQVRHYEYLYGAQLRLRWSSSDFPEEVIPTSQLYPDDYLSSPEVSKVISVETITLDQLRVRTESYKNTIVEYTIVTATGIVLDHLKAFVPIGKSEISLHTAQLPAGVYYLQGLDLEDGGITVTPFVKL